MILVRLIRKRPRKRASRFIAESRGCSFLLFFSPHFQLALRESLFSPFLIMTDGLPFTATRSPPVTANIEPISLTFPTHGDSGAGLIAQITLISPSNLNALRSVDMQQLIAVLDWINEQPHILITVFTGRGRFLSAGANVSDPARQIPEELTTLPDTDPRHVQVKKEFFAGRAHMNNSRIGRAFYNHNKILIGAPNGPVVGITASILAYADFIYCFDAFWLATPFTSLALVAEGGASAAFVRKVRKKGSSLFV